MGIDMKDKKCMSCEKGTFIETSQFDDVDGVLHCSNCGRRITRWLVPPDCRPNEDADSAAVALFAQNKILLLRRSPTCKVQGMCLPGGMKDDIDGSTFETAIRELWEETGLSIINLSTAGNIQSNGMTYCGVAKSSRGANVDIYSIELLFTAPVMLSCEHDGYAWLDVDYLGDFKLSGNTQKFIDMAMEKRNDKS